MAPGPRKKNSNRQFGDSRSDDKRTSRPTNQSQPVDKKDISSSSTENVTNSDVKYSSRTIASNWNKYEEPVDNPHADSMRGEDFEVLLSYSGGKESQLRMQDEKDWDEVSVTDKSIAVDMKDLVCAVKSIPFHKRMNLPENIFDVHQLAKFESYAESWKMSYVPKENLQNLTKKKADSIESKTPDYNFDIIESYETEEPSDIPMKSFMLEEKTETIIESLASCLSMKCTVQEKIEDSSTKNESNSTDDLDFLLSLSVPSQKTMEDKPSVVKQTNIDDWLNNILDD